MSKIYFRREKVLKKGILFSVIAVMIFMGYYIFYSITENDHKERISAGASSVINSLKLDDGVQKVDVKLVSRYVNFIPTDNTYGIFVDVTYDSLRKRNEDEWVKYIVGEGKIDTIYGSELLFSTQAVKMSDEKYSNNPIIITVSDDTQHYCLGRKYSFTSSAKDVDDLAIVRSTALQRSGFTDVNRYKTWSMLMGIVCFLTAGFLVYSLGKKKHRFIDAVTKFYIECQEKGVSETDEAELREIVAAYAPEIDVDDIDEAVTELYQLGKNRHTADKQKAQMSKGKLIAVSAGILVIAVAGIVVCNNMIVRANKYEKAIAMKNDGDMESAYELFMELGNYKDSKTQCKEYDYAKAVIYYGAGQYAKCYQELIKIEGYEPAAELLNNVITEYPYVTILSANIGDTVVIGEYEQDNNLENGKEPIEWTVLGWEGGKMLLISKYILDAQPFNTSNSIECTLDDWITDTFFLEAFSDTKIDENIICAMLFFENDKDLYFSRNDYEMTSATAYARSIPGFHKGYKGTYGYWLAGNVFGDTTGKAHAPVGLEDGISNDCCNVGNVDGVRPTLWICPGGEDTFPATATYSGKVPEKWRSTHGGGSGNKCGTCNGTGSVRYYYGSSALEAALSGHNDFEVGPCPSCHGSGRSK